MTDGESGETVGETSEGLQVELFHPETDRKPGDTNIERFGFDIHPVVFPLALAIIVLFVVATIALGDAAATAYTDIFNWVNANFGWFYILVVNIFIAALIFFALSKYGKIRLGGVEADHEFSHFSWMAMLFSAGMGIGLMFWGVAEPMWHLGTGGGSLFAQPGYMPGNEVAADGAAAYLAMSVALFHWGFHPWAVYGLVALGLGFFSFNRGLPLTFRSVFYPLLGDRIYGWWGHLIDLVTVFATIFGLGTSLGLGAQQINAGLNIVSGGALPQGTASQVGIIAVITGIATLSVAAGLHRGVKRLSHVNVYIMLLLLGFVFVVGPTLFILDTWVASIGGYLQNFMHMSFFQEALAGDLPAFSADLNNGYAGWRAAWTVFFWGWWIAWSPFVGLFIARISKGKTVRQMVMGVLLIPTAFTTFWFSTIAGSAIYAQANLGSNVFQIATFRAAEGVAQGREFAMFAMLAEYPLSTLTSLVAVLLVTTFFVTSSDSGSLVIDHLTSGGKHDVPRTQRIFWAVTEGVVAAALLVGGGVTALQTASVTTGLPFAFILLVMVYSIFVGLDGEYNILQSEEFRERVGEIAEAGGDVDIAGGEVVTGVRDAEPDD